MKKKAVIYAVIAVVILGIGILMGVLISGGENTDKIEKTAESEISAGNKASDTLTEGAASENENAADAVTKQSNAGDTQDGGDPADTGDSDTQDSTGDGDTQDSEDPADTGDGGTGSGKSGSTGSDKSGSTGSDKSGGTGSDKSGGTADDGDNGKDTEPVTDTGFNKGTPGDAGTAKGTTAGNAVSTLNTGKLTEKGNGYEGKKGTGKYNYGEALQKSLLFYELQRSGDLPENVRCNWRGDSCLNDGKDAGTDLTGGWFDAGDNVKFNLPMAYTAAMLGWSIYESYDAYKESGQLEYALSNIKWANDYFIKCHPEDEVYYYQVGDGNQDHSYWGACETVEYRMSRPSYKVTKSSPGSAVCGETAASLAICSIVYKNIDKAYSEKCLKHAKSLYKFAADTKSDAGYRAANGFYDSWSGFYDELAWSGAWLYVATDDKTYLTNAESDFTKAGHDYNWAMCWDDVHIGAAVMLAKLTGKTAYRTELEKHLDWWSGVSSDHITYSPKGLAWLDTWGSLRYATTEAFIATVYADSGLCSSSKSSSYWKFAESQINYALGDGGRSYEIGFGTNPPKNPHHRTAQGSYCDNMNEPSTARHTLYGALVGGPDANDGYSDVVSDYNKNEVACDYNAGFTGILAKMYGKYKGQTLKDFGAVEKISANELYVEGGINVDGSDFMELRAYICNTSAWPARVPEKLEFRYYVDLSEIYRAGGSAANVNVTTNYMAAGTSNGLKCWDEDKHIYYLSVDFSGASIYPGGQDKYRKEIQVRLRNENGPWDNSNDPSYYNMAKGGTQLLERTALYENGKLVFGYEPAKGSNAGKSVVYSGGGSGNAGSGNGGNTGNGGNSGNSGNTGNGGNSGGNGGSSGPVTGTAKNAKLTVSADYDNVSSASGSISGRLNIINNSDGTLSLKDLTIKLYFTNEGGGSLQFDCYHTAINGKTGAYTELSGCSGEFASASGKDTDTVCTMSYSDNKTLGVGDTLTCAFAIHHGDWSNMNLTNDYSLKDAGNIVILNGKKTVFGAEP